MILFSIKKNQKFLFFIKNLKFFYKKKFLSRISRAQIPFMSTLPSDRVENLIKRFHIGQTRLQRRITLVFGHRTAAFISIRAAFSKHGPCRAALDPVSLIVLSKHLFRAAYFIVIFFQGRTLNQINYCD